MSIAHLYWTLELDPKPLDKLIVLRKNIIFSMKKGPIEGSICFKLVLELLVPRLLFKMALVLLTIFLNNVSIFTYTPFYFNDMTCSNNFDINEFQSKNNNDMIQCVAYDKLSLFAPRQRKKKKF